MSGSHSYYTLFGVILLVEAMLALVAVSSPLDALQPSLLEERVHMEQAADGMQ